ncbi:S1 RNA-binding domain-containing protein [Candidatus Peregrinibacteria bacterium]|nr:S1 RNA-binding domain-containing protein [Candidatus Peregrinibacteria bacterium]
MSDDTTFSMEELLKNSPSFVSVDPGSVISGRVIGKEHGRILVDIGGVVTGIVSGRELTDTFSTAKKVKVGDEISVFVLEDEGPDGMVVLSLRKASQMKAWEYFQKIKDEGGVVEVIAKEANKGGLMVEVSGVTAFLPVSQLAPHNYPRVDGANAQEILTKLEKLVGKKFTTKIILIDPEIRKLVVSERVASSEIRQKELVDLKVGDVITGEVNGLVKFGIFVTFGNLEGLVHISELTWAHVKTPTELFRMGDQVKAQVIGVEGEKISLSIKRLLPDPWVGKITAYSVGSIHDGVINKVTNFGVFVTLEEDVNGLVHTSEFVEENADPEKLYKEGNEVTVKVLEILNDDHSLRLSFKGVESGGKRKAAEEPVQKEEEKTPKVEASGDEKKEEGKEKKVTKKKAAPKKEKASEEKPKKPSKKASSKKDE